MITMTGKCSLKLTKLPKGERFIFAFGTKIFIEAITVFAVTWLGGGAMGWRNIAIIYAVIGLILSIIGAAVGFIYTVILIIGIAFAFMDSFIW